MPDVAVIVDYFARVRADVWSERGSVVVETVAIDDEEAALCGVVVGVKLEDMRERLPIVKRCADRMKPPALRIRVLWMDGTAVENILGVGVPFVNSGLPIHVRMVVLNIKGRGVDTLAFTVTYLVSLDVSQFVSSCVHS